MVAAHPGWSGSLGMDSQGQQDQVCLVHADVLAYRCLAASSSKPFAEGKLREWSASCLTKVCYMVALENQIENFVWFGDNASGAVVGKLNVCDATSGRWLEILAKKSVAYLCRFCFFNASQYFGNFVISRKCFGCCSFM